MLNDAETPVRVRPGVATSAELPLQRCHPERGIENAASQLDVLIRFIQLDKNTCCEFF